VPNITFTWTSTNPAVATVTASAANQATVTALRTGIVTLTATAADGSDGHLGE
jgi:uncharacterized protein YjdB